MHKQIFALVFLLFSFFLLIPNQNAEAANYTVTPANLRGWTFWIDGTVPYNFTDDTGTSGIGSLQFGPIDGGNPSNKFVIQAPYLNGLASDFDSFSYDIYVDPLSAKGSQYFYTNVYVDSAANGVGTLATWYDCRYDFATPAGLPTGVWDSRSFDENFTGWVSRGEPIGVGTCPNSIGTLPVGSRIMFIRINGGGSTAADAGFMGAIDNVVISTASRTDFYNFEPLVNINPDGSISVVRMPLDDRINNMDEATPIAAYNLDYGTGQGLIVYEISGDSKGFNVLVVTPEEIAAVPEKPETNTLIAEERTDNLQIMFWRLSSGEFQINVIQPNGKMYVLIFKALAPGGAGYSSFEYTME